MAFFLDEYNVAASIAPTIDTISAGSGPLASIDWGTQVTPNGGVVNVYFATTGETYDGDTASANWSAYEIQQTMLSLQQFSNVVNITFQQVATQAQANFTLVQNNIGSSLGSFVPPGYSNSGNGWFNNQGQGWDTAGGLAQGGYGFVTLLHEFGHGMGLAHPHDNGGSSTVMAGVTSPFNSLGVGNLNQGIWTTMSYNDGWRDGPQGLSPSDNYGWQGTLMALDIASLQADYGANTSYNSGNSTYVLPDLNAGGTFYSCIWDGGGTDAITYGGSRSVVIDLRPATLLQAVGGGGYVSYASGIHGGFTIAANVVIENATGGSGSDTITGNSAANILNGGAGSDILNGGGGDDFLIGGFGSDNLSGGDGFDTVDYTAESQGVQLHLQGTGYGGAANGDSFNSIEQVWGTAFGDWIEGGPSNESLYGFDGDDGLLGNAGADQLYGGNGNDTLYGSWGNDMLNGEAGNDTLNGGDNGDWLSGGAGADTLNGDAGIDYLDGGDGNDTMNGDTGNDTLLGGAGDDIINAGDEDDYVLGGDGVDTVTGGLGIDAMFGGNGNDTISGGSGSDYILGEADNDTLNGDDGNDGIRGGTGNDIINGGTGADYMLGENGADIINGGNDNDYLFGGADNDTLNGDDGADYLAGEAGTDALNGGAGNDVLLGGLHGDTLGGGGDNDLLLGEAGDDYEAGGNGNDRIEGGDGADTLLGELGTDYLYGDAGTDNILGGSGIDLLFGGADTDTLTGGLDSDYLTGGTSSDIFVFDANWGSDVVLDWQSGVDHLDFRPLAGLGLHSTAGFTFYQVVGGNCTIGWGGNFITIQGFNALVNNGDFYFT